MTSDPNALRPTSRYQTPNSTNLFRKEGRPHHRGLRGKDRNRAPDALHRDRAAHNTLVLPVDGMAAPRNS